jgi:hypothetical protein
LTDSDIPSNMVKAWIEARLEEPVILTLEAVEIMAVDGAGGGIDAGV